MKKTTTFAQSVLEETKKEDQKKEWKMNKDGALEMVDKPIPPMTPEQMQQLIEQLHAHFNQEGAVLTQETWKETIQGVIENVVNKVKNTVKGIC